MNDDQIDDLKQYIAATISQVTADMATKSDIATLKGDIATLKSDVAVLKSDVADLQTHVDSRLDEIQASIAESLSVTNDSVDEQISAHDVRITKLEQSSAR
jgi:hypothetical protein